MFLQAVILFISLIFRKIIEMKTFQTSWKKYLMNLCNVKRWKKKILKHTKSFLMSEINLIYMFVYSVQESYIFFLNTNFYLNMLQKSLLVIKIKCFSVGIKVITSRRKLV